MEKRSSIEDLVVGIGKAITPPFIRDQVKRAYYSVKKKSLAEKFAKEIKEKSYIKWYQEFIDNKAESFEITDELISTGSRDLEAMKARGMKPEHTLYEFGVGYLRSTKHFVEYLNPGNFTGNDTSAKRIARGKKLFPVMDEKKANLLVTTDNSLDWLNGKKFDFIYSHAVFCHMPMEDVREVFINLHDKAMHEKSEFYTTYSVLDFNEFRGLKDTPANEMEEKLIEIFRGKDQMNLFDHMKKSQGEDVIQSGSSNWFQSREYMERFSRECGFHVEDVTESLGDKTGLCYSPWNRLIKMTLK